MIAVSVIIPYYNREAFLSEAIQSVIDQTFQNWELLLVDDGSSDNSAAIAAKFAATDQRITLYQRTNEIKGPSSCRNIGAKNAQGKYLVFLDSDDFIANFCLERRVSAMEANPSLDFAVFNLNFFIGSTSQDQRLFNTTASSTEEYLQLFFQLNTPWATPCPIWKRSFFLSTGGFNESFLVKTDPELHSRVLLKHQPVFEYFEKTQPDCFYRVHEDPSKKQYIKHAAIFFSYSVY